MSNSIIIQFLLNSHINQPQMFLCCPSRDSPLVVTKFSVASDDVTVTDTQWHKWQARLGRQSPRHWR